MHFKLKIQFSILFKLLITAAIVSWQAFNVSGQQKTLPDSVIFKPLNKPAKEKVYHPDSTHSPLGAVIKSAIIPGWGQLYNKKWWQVPLIYGGFASLTVIMIYNHRHYVKDLTVYRYYDNPSAVKSTMLYYDYFQELLKYHYTQQQVAAAVDGYDRDFQLGVLGTAGLWAIQMVDAYIDAKFIHSFTMDNNLGFKISPGILTQPAYAINYNAAIVPVLRITLTLPR